MAVRTRMTPPLRILICRSDVLGDNLYSLPVAEDLRAAFPDCRITWLTRAGVAPLIRMDRNVQEVLEWDDRTDPAPLRAIQPPRSGARSVTGVSSKIVAPARSAAPASPRA